MNDWMDAEQRIERAQQLCESRCWEEALEQIDRALEINPSNSSWWSSKGFLLDHLERYEAAITAYERALEHDPDDRELLSALGLDCVRTGQLLRAIDIFDRVQQIDPGYEPAYCHRIMMYAELGDHDLAEEMFYSAQQIDEHCPHCFWHLGCSLWMRDDVQRAIWCWQRLLEIEPNYRGARRRLAEAYRRLGETRLAQDYYLAEYRDDAGNVGLLLELGSLHLENGRTEDALMKFGQALELDPHHARAMEMLGDTHSHAGEADRALELYRSALQIDDTLPGLHYKLGAKLMRLGCFEDARESLAAALDIHPADTDALMAAGNCALELSRTDEARERFEELIAIDDCLPGAYHNLGVCHFLQDNYEEGMKQCELALELKGDYGMARQKLVLANVHLGRWAEAKRLLTESLNVIPGDPALLELRRTWKYRRLTLWAKRLARRIHGLVNRSRSC